MFAMPLVDGMLVDIVNVDENQQLGCAHCA
jgi:hypothetical protein